MEKPAPNGAACPFVTQIMKVENLNLQISALPAEGVPIDLPL
jgi:hypothetical protein